MSAVRCNVNVSSYDRDVVFRYDCVRSGRCRFGICPTMPPDPDMECAFYRRGSCVQMMAQLAALANLKRDITAEIKRLEAEAKEGV